MFIGYVFILVSLVLRVVFIWLMFFVEFEEMWMFLLGKVCVIILFFWSSCLSFVVWFLVGI